MVNPGLESVPNTTLDYVGSVARCCVRRQAEARGVEVLSSKVQCRDGEWGLLLRVPPWTDTDALPAALSGVLLWWEIAPDAAKDCRCTD